MENLKTIWQKGFTLIELMITVTVLAILASLAAPSFREIIVSQRARAAASELYDSLILARSEAVKRNNIVSVKANSNDFSKGWEVLLADGTTSIRSQGSLTGLTLTTSTSATAFDYSPLGRLGGSSVATVSGAGSAKQWKVVISASGRVCVVEGGGSC